MGALLSRKGRRFDPRRERFEFEEETRARRDQLEKDCRRDLGVVFKEDMKALRDQLRENKNRRLGSNG